jgi:hypothetical protein
MFSGVMTTRKSTDFLPSRRSLRPCVDRDAANIRPMSFSARNLLFLTPTSDLRNLPTANCQLTTVNRQLFNLPTDL